MKKRVCFSLTPESWDYGYASQLYIKAIRSKRTGEVVHSEKPQFPSL